MLNLCVSVLIRVLLLVRNTMKRLVLPFIILLLLLATPDAAASQPSVLSPHHFVVSPDGPYTTIAAALAEAQDGDTIEVWGGVHAAPLLVDKAVTLVGLDGAVIDGGAKGRW